MRFFLMAMIIFVSGCVSIPDGIEPVKDFQSNRYLGQWYEIARLDHSFERGLEQVTATYSMREDGGIKVINRGLDTEFQQWQEAEGKAYFVGERNEGHLKVSFFGPFYGSFYLSGQFLNFHQSLAFGITTKGLIFVKQDDQLSDAVTGGEK